MVYAAYLSGPFSRGSDPFYSVLGLGDHGRPGLRTTNLEQMPGFVWGGPVVSLRVTSQREARIGRIIFYHFTKGAMCMHPFIKFGLSLVGVVCLLAGPAWAQDDDSAATTQTVSGTNTGRASYVFEWNPDGVVSSFRGTSAGADNVFGAFTCSFAGTNSYLGEAEPPAADTTGVCNPDSASLGLYGSYNYSRADCQYDDTGQAFTLDVPGTAVTCAPFSCFAGPLTTDAGTEFYTLTAGCTYPAFYTLTSMAEDGTWTAEGESMETLTIRSAEYDAARGVVVTRASSTFTGMGTATLTIPEDELPANDVTLEVPASGATMSGIGLISGWSCLGGTLEAEISDATGDVSTVALSHGTSRADTESVCGDSNNGFSATVNWSLFAAGPKTIRLLQNGAEVGAARAFSVVPFGTEFISGASGMCSIGDFPTAGESATVAWDETQQRFVVTQIN